ncbi:MAG: hypothetical protein ACRDGI_02810 [Candidatus Limnocylindrales bacterium]
MTVVVLAFVVGHGVGSRTVPDPSPSPPPAFATGQIGHDLWLAYLGLPKRLDGWTICRLGTPITCQAAYAAPFRLFPNSDALPLTVTAHDWQTLRVASLPAGHWILAGPERGSF